MITAWEFSARHPRADFWELRNLTEPLLFHARRVECPDGVTGADDLHPEPVGLVIDTDEGVRFSGDFGFNEGMDLMRAMQEHRGSTGLPVTLRGPPECPTMEPGDTRTWDDICHEDVAAARGRYAGAVAEARAVLQATIAAAAIVEAQEVAAAEQRCAERRKG